MATFIYKAKKASAETVTGQIMAETQDEAIDLINQLGLLPVTVQPKSVDDAELDMKNIKKISSKELYLFSRQLSNLLKSGISLVRSLAILESQMRNKTFKKVIAQISAQVKNGRSFSECLMLYPKIFSTLYVTMVHAGEESGNLQEMLLKIAHYKKAQEEISSKVRMALAYPMLMAVVGILTVYFILTFVLPKMASLFRNIGDDLPLPTAILLNLSEMLSKGWMGVLLAVLVVIFLVQQWIKTQNGRSLISQLALRMPLYGRIILRTELARFCRTLVLLLKSGTTITRALKVSIPIISNEVIKIHFTHCQESLLAGGSFGDAIKRSKDIPPMMGDLISIGEESGNLDEVLDEIADSYETETKEYIKIITTLLEPIMILAVGAVIGFIVFAMLLPIFQMDVLAG